MGQAKVRGTYEQRKAEAIQREKDRREARDAQRRDRFVILRWILTQKGTKISLAFSKKGFGLKMGYREIWIWFFWMRFHWKQEL